MYNILCIIPAIKEVIIRLFQCIILYYFLYHTNVEYIKFDKIPKIKHSELLYSISLLFLQS
jgi:hypothetical protein